jgi:acyl-CoA synthetase (AMP-forming)/AMP-acid ligase II
MPRTPPTSTTPPTPSRGTRASRAPGATPSATPGAAASAAALPPTSSDTPDDGLCATIGDQLAQAARQRGSATACIDDDLHHSWATLDAAADQMACGLLALGLQRGDRIGILALNQIEWLLLFYAAAKVGVGVVGLSVRYRDNDLGHMLADAQVKVVFTVQQHEGCDFITMLERLGRSLPALRHVVAIDGHGLTSLQALAATPIDAGKLAAARRRVLADDLAMVIYTSGTTGRPKGAGLTHRSLLASAAAQAAHLKLGMADVLHMATPLNHVGGITCGVLAHLVGGGTLVLVPEFKAGPVLQLMSRYRPTIVAGVPTMLTLLLMHAAVDAVDFSAVRLVFSGGANVDPVLLERLQQRMPQATLMNIYGLSETSGGIVMTPWQASDDDRLHCLGTPFAGAQLRVAGPAGEALAAGQVGELWFKGCGTVPGYIGAAAGQGFSPDGWLMTGDLGSVDARGLITLKGRKKDMYIQGGFNVYPAEVEALICRHPQVLMAAVISVADPVLGEIGRACVVARPGVALASAELRQWCAEHLADYKVPRQWQLCDELPMTPAGKIHKAALREALALETAAGTAGSAAPARVAAAG